MYIEHKPHRPNVTGANKISEKVVKQEVDDVEMKAEQGKNRAFKDLKKGGAKVGFIW